MSNESENAKFSLSGATLYGINAVVGSGIFLLPKKIYSGLGPASLLAMVVDVVLVLLLALCFAEVAGYFDKNGGAFQYSKAAFGDFVGFDVGLLGWLVTIIAWSAMAAGFAKIAATLIPPLEDYKMIVSLLLVLFLSVINSFGVKTSKNFTVIITIAKLVPIIAFVIISLFFIKGGIEGGNFSPFVQLGKDAAGNTLTVPKAMGATSITIFYAFIGFEALPIVAGEMRNPRKNVPRAIIMSILIVSFLYFIIITGTIAMLGKGIMQSGAPVQDAFEKMIGPLGKYLISIGALISIAGLNMGDSMMVPRYAASIADEGLLPKAIAKQNRRGAPIVAIVISGILTAILVASGSFEQLAELSVVMRFIQYIPTALAVIVLRKKDMGVKPSFTLPLGPVIPILGVIVSVWMLAASTPINLIFGGVLLVLASIMYFFMHGRNGSGGVKKPATNEE